MKHKAKEFTNLKLKGEWTTVQKGEIIEHPFRELNGFVAVFEELDVNKDGVFNKKDASIGSKIFNKIKKDKKKKSKK